MAKHDHYSRNELEAFVDETVSANRYAEIDAHVTGCDKCQSTLDEITRSRDDGDPLHTLLKGLDEETAPFGQPIGLAAVPLAEGDRIGDYTIVRLLGQGGFGEVYLATNEAGWNVALKLPLYRASLKKQHKQFLREAQSLKKLNHANIVKILEVGEAFIQPVVNKRKPSKTPIPFLAMEYIEGESFASIIKNDGDTGRCLQILEQVGHALSHAHKCNVFHRDLKPSNILVRPNGTVCIVDFGLAVEESNQRNFAGQIAGSLHYMPPELLNGDIQFMDGRSDIWSLGVMLYRILTKRLPFQGSCPAELIENIRCKDHRPIAVFAKVSPLLREICDGALRKEKAQRTESAEQFAVSLKDAMVIGKYYEGTWFLWLRLWILQVFSPEKVISLDGVGGLLFKRHRRVTFAVIGSLICGLSFSLFKFLETRDNRLNDQAHAVIQHAQDCDPAMLDEACADLDRVASGNGYVAELLETQLENLPDIPQESNARVGLAAIPYSEEALDPALDYLLTTPEAPRQLVTLLRQRVKDNPQHYASLSAKLQDSALHKSVKTPWANGAALATNSKMRRAFERAHAMIAPGFVFAQKIPRAHFKGMNGHLKNSGYQPVVIRPWQKRSVAYVAGIWYRTDAHVESRTANSKSELQRLDDEMTKKGFQPLDIGIQRGKYIGEIPRFCTLWSKRSTADPERHIRCVGPGDRDSDEIPFRLAKNDVGDWFGIWETGDPSVEVFTRDNERWPDYFEVIPAIAGIEISTSKKHVPTYQQVRQKRTLLESLKGITKTANKRNQLWSYIGRTVLSEGDINSATRYIKSAAQSMTPSRLQALPDLAMIHAVNQDHEKAQNCLNDLEHSLHRSNYSKSWIQAFMALVRAKVGIFDADSDAFEKLDAIATESDSALTRYFAACGHAFAYSKHADKNSDDAKWHERKAVDFLRAAIDRNISLSRVQISSDLDSIIEHPEIQSVFKPEDVALYSGFFVNDPNVRAQDINGLSPAAHLTRCKRMARLGYYPVSLDVESVGGAANARTVTASVWHIRKSSPGSLRKRARAIALLVALQLDAPDSMNVDVQELFDTHLQKSPSPEFRDHLISEFGAIADLRPTMLEWAQQTNEPSVCQALLNAADLSARNAPKQDRLKFLNQIRNFASDPNPAIHMTARAILTRFDTTAFGTWENHNDDSSNVHDQSMVHIEPGLSVCGASPFDDKSPAPQQQRMVSIDRPLQISAGQITVGEFRKFDPDYLPFLDLDPNRPAQVSWYQAVQYVCWLNEQAGIPREDWWYIPNANGEFAAGMKVRPTTDDCSGYRLPTSDEWEVSARGGVVADFPDGDGRNLEEYGWIRDNAANVHQFGDLNAIPWKRPNSLGLVQTIGGLAELCHDSMRSDGTEEEIDDSTRRFLRGGNLASARKECRFSAYQFVVPDQWKGCGFRIVFTN